MAIFAERVFAERFLAGRVLSDAFCRTRFAGRVLPDAFQFNSYCCVQIYLWGVAATILTAYTALSLTIPIPGCRMPPLTTSCNAAAWVDAKLLRPTHMYPFPTCRRANPPCAVFDPEGLFTTLGGAMSSAGFGVALGSHFVYQRGHAVRLAATSGSALAFVAAGLLLLLFGCASPQCFQVRFNLSNVFKACNLG